MKRTIILTVITVLLVIFTTDVITDVILDVRYGDDSAHLDGRTIHAPVAPVGWVEFVGE